MTNKTERFLVMSEAEFEAALSAQRWFTAHDSDDLDNGIQTVELLTRLQEAEAACRAREVLTFSDTPSRAPVKEIWVEVKK